VSALPPAPAEARLVVQTGATALTAALFATAFAYGAVLAGLIVAATSTGADPSERFIYLVPIVFAGVAIGSNVWAWRARASDVFLSEAGLRLEGGRWSGRAWTWAEVDVDRTRLVTDFNASVTTNGHRTYRRAFVLGLTNGEEVELASSFDDAEHASLEALLVAVQARLAPAPVAAPVEGLLGCGSCGAPVAPQPAETSPCWSCGAAVPTPAALADKVRAAQRVAAGRGAAEARIRSWLEQPPAAAVNRWLAAVFMVRYGLPLLLCLGSGQWAAILLGAWTIGRVCWLTIIDRFAYRSLSLDWAARPAAAPGAPPRCRACAAPIAPRAGDVIARCAACDADNVLGVDLARAEAEVQVARVDIEQFIAAQAERRGWPRVQVGLGALATAVAFVWGALA
jgi:hypothetical protein